MVEAFIPPAAAFVIIRIVLVVNEVFLVFHNEMFGLLNAYANLILAIHAMITFMFPTARLLDLHLLINTFFVILRLVLVIN